MHISDISSWMVHTHTHTLSSLIWMGLASDLSSTWMSCTSSSPSGRGIVSSSAAPRAASSNWSKENRRITSHNRLDDYGYKSKCMTTPTRGRNSEGSLLSLSASRGSKLERSSRSTSRRYWRRL